MRRSTRGWPGSRLPLIAICLLAAAGPASAQTLVTGHYQALVAGGLKSGVLLPRPGVVVQNGWWFYNARTFTDNDGDVIPTDAELNIIATRVVGLWQTGVKILGADYAAALALPFANLAPNPVFVLGQPLKTGGLGVGDIAFNPLRLGWHWTAFHAQFDYTLFLPVGRFEQGASDNVGKGFWTHMLTAAGTWMPPADNPWHVSLQTRYEMHSTVRDSDLRPGTTLTLEFGAGKRLSPKVDLGLVAFYWGQITDASGEDATPPLLKYRIAGIGAELQWRISRLFLLKFRPAFDVASVNASEGPAFLVEFSYLP